MTTINLPGTSREISYAALLLISNELSCVNATRFVDEAHMAGIARG